MLGNPLFAFGFTNLAMLGWLAAAAAPLVIHLWSRRKYREVPWAAVTFLLAAMRRSARRIQLQQWLLLAVRTIIIVLVVLAVAEPYGAGSLAGGGGGAPAHKVIVIDGSYSMAFRGGEATCFERAKQLAAGLVRDSGPGDSFTVILLAEPARTILGRDVVDHAIVASQIESLAQSHAGGDLAGALSLAEEALDEADERRSGLRKEVYFFSDLQRVSWGEDTIAQRLAALAGRVRLVAIDVGGDSQDNLAVTQLSMSDAFVTTGGDTSIEATLHQFGSQARNECIVELFVDDVPVDERTVDVPGGGDVTVRFDYRFRTAGEHAVSVRAGADALSLDDTRWLVAPVQSEVQVLCVEGKSGAARFVAGALDPDPTDASPVRPVIASEGDLAELELTKFECVFLCNVGRLTSGEFDRLARYAAAGGGVVVYLGDRVQTQAYNELSADDPQSAIRNPQSTIVETLLPARIGEVVSQQNFAVDPLEYRHPIVAPFRGRERAGLLTTPVAKYFRLDVSPSRAGVEVAAALPGGDPWIVTAPFGRGRVIVVATDGSLSSVDEATGEPWTAWPTWPSFLPLVRETLAYAVGGQRDARQQLVGSPLRARRAAGWSSGAVEQRRSGVEEKSSGEADYSTPPLLLHSSLTIDRPDRRTETIRVAGERGDWSYVRADVSGIYSIRAAGESEPLLFAVNLNTAESELTRIDRQQLPPEMVVSSHPEAGGEPSAGEFSRRAGWQQSLLFAAFGLLFVESLMAWRFGRGTL
jgi:hypothetical protein